MSFFSPHAPTITIKATCDTKSRCWQRIKLALVTCVVTHERFLTFVLNFSPLRQRGRKGESKGGDGDGERNETRGSNSVGEEMRGHI